ncbi:hypothetical protein FRC04_004362 [Tulasnella sp. 424]|nr:hypothetical protein FRC04_004362 [Tulasnella sp. 424]KAG8979473.1 hypothetical protein FRC05_008462 [Tulasnella sp. 425]
MIQTTARRMFIYLGIAISCFLVIQLGLKAQTRDYRSAKHWSALINDPTLQLKGLIHVLKHYPDQPLPEVEDGTLLSPHALGVEEVIRPSEWIRRVMATEKETPLVVFSKTYCPYSQAAKRLLEKYEIEPKPFIVETNLRNDTLLLKKYLTRLTGRGTVPNIILKGRSIGGSDDIHSMHNSHDLKPRLEEGGLVVKGSP